MMIKLQMSLILMLTFWASASSSSQQLPTSPFPAIYAASRSGFRKPKMQMPMILNRRAGKSLVNTFPFNTGAHHGGHHGHHDHSNDHAHDHSNDRAHDQHNDHHEAHHDPHVTHELPQRLDSRFGKQRPDASLSEDLISVDLGAVAAAGERCIEKVMMVEETLYDDSIECHHSYDQRCHTTYSTHYEPTQVEDCDENFVKECHIEYKKIAFNESVEICNQRQVRDCQQEGPTVCEKVYESECETTYHVHDVEEDSPVCTTQIMKKCRDVTQGYSTKEECDEWPQQVCNLERKTVKKYSPETECKKVPREVCGPGPCPIVAGPRECRKEKKTVVQEQPEETCSLRAQPYCEYETKLVPVLKPRENCVDVPKEVCVRMRTNPRKVKKPVIKKWCYTPTEESGLSTDDNNENTDDLVSGTGTDTTAADNSDDDGEVVDVVPAPSTASPATEVTTSQTTITFPAAVVTRDDNTADEAGLAASTASSLDGETR